MGCLHDTGTRFIPVRTAFTWESFYRKDTKFHVSLRSYKPVWSVVDYRQACATRPSQLSHSSRTGTKPHDTGTKCGQISYRYENRSELVPVQHFVLQVGTGMNSYRNETRTDIM